MINGERKIAYPLRWGMVGGGRTGQVGYKHRSGALLHNTAFRLVAGAFDIDAARGRDFGSNLGIDPDRCYADYLSMFREEAKRRDGVQVVSIATPNGTHYPITKAALEAGLHVICEKPLFFSTNEVREIQSMAAERRLVVGVTYGFSGHPLLLQMRAMVETGEIGEIRIIDLQYTHGFNSTDSAERTSDAQRWRVDPQMAGPTFVLGDLSTHTFYMSQLIAPKMRIRQILCDRQSFIPSRAPLEDNAFVLMRYEGGAVGRMWASSVNAGCMDSQQIRIVGSKASLVWSDTYPSELRYEVQGKPTQIMHRGMPYLDATCNSYERLGPLHAEGLIESWANIYLNFAIAIDAKRRGDGEALAKLVYPGIEAGLEGVRWLENCVRSSEAGGAWIDYQ